METMNIARPIDTARVEDKPAAWGAVVALALSAFALIASEFLPVSLLTPVAASLAISEGRAGQAIAISGAFALVTSLVLPALAGRFDRKLVLLALSFMMIVSGTVVACAPDFAVFMLGRAVLGVAIGGFWSLSAATAMRLVPAHQVPRALAILNGGNALATVVAAPLGSFLGEVVGWRGAFFCVVPLAAAAFLWKWCALPALPAQQGASAGNVLRLLARPAVTLGMAAVSLFFMGQFALFTYLRPFLEKVTGVDVSTLSVVLLMIGVAGVAGTSLIGRVLKGGLYRVLVAIPMLMAAIALLLIGVGSSLTFTSILLAGWGLVATAAPVGWWTWLARTLPRDAEAGGGLIVAVIQLAIMLGATAGGLLFDHSGYQATFAASAAVLLASSGLAMLAGRAGRQHERR